MTKEICILNCKRKDWSHAYNQIKQATNRNIQITHENWNQWKCQERCNALDFCTWNEENVYHQMLENGWWSLWSGYSQNQSTQMVLFKGWPKAFKSEEDNQVENTNMNMQHKLLIWLNVWCYITKCTGFPY